ncbi:phosphatidylglycerophosphatase A [Limnochorda pilosa]|uniref:Phosphatidylglycerophosphatase n=1 Tax=Limnochorda pilosa TaxID=1555112 RepID=A0A0K2SIX9_LIMPI|nr:phosphatidylglycerophosphatase A [Limnochorda pilosa]BAS27058.1 phosphatidylglycerophosphatase [Limnochorda pilosa]
MGQADVQQMLDMLGSRGADPEAMARLVHDLQRPYIPDLTLEEARAHLHAVLAKREVQYAVITGVTLDRMAEAGRLDEPLGSIVREDPVLYGVDKGLALSIVNAYGSIGMSNFGFLVHERPAFFSAFRTGPERVHTFLDDLMAGLVAAACARIAHRAGDVAEGEAPS